LPFYKHRNFGSPIWGNLTDRVYEYDSVDSGIYILECEQDKYYVGQSKDMMRRLIQHRYFRSVKWLKKFPPLKIYLLFLCDVETLGYWEREYTRAMVWKFGISKVRGGSWTRVNLCMGDDQDELKEFYKKFYARVPKHFGSSLV